MCGIMSASDIPPVPASILKRKSDISRVIDSNSRHTLETNVNDGNVTNSVKRTRPSSSHEEPTGIAAISEWKRNAKHQLAKKDSDKPSRKVRNRNNNRNGDDWLIDAAFDQVVGAGKAIGKAAKATGKVAGKAAKTGFHATKTGIKAINEISDEVVKNPMLIRMGQTHEATLAGMASQRRHALNSIVATGANRKYLSAGSLVKQHGLGTTTTTSSVSPHTTTGANRVITKIVRRGNKDVQANTASTTVEQSYSRDNTGSIVGKSAKSASGLVTRQNNALGSNQTTTNPVLNKPKVASPSGLVTRHNSGLGANQSNGNTVDDSEHSNSRSK
jgi:hypothetical protein